MMWMYYILSVVVILFAVVLWIKMIKQNKTYRQIISRDLKEIKTLKKGNEKKEYFKSV